MEKEFIQSVIKLFDRDLSKLEKEIELYTNENTLWSIGGDIKNSSGNLCLHLCGNLQHFIGTMLGNTGYKRDRDNEFIAKGIAQQDLLTEIRKTKSAVIETLENLDHQLLSKNYPIEVFGQPMTTLFFLIHLAGHLNYHLGQVNYHRRLLSATS